MEWQTELRNRGGAATRRDLRGLTDRVLAAIVESGQLVRPRRGIYALPELSSEALAALAAGGRLSCCAAARSYGLWGGMDGRLHLYVGAHAGRTGSYAVRHWGAHDDHAELWRVSFGDCLRSVVACAAEETAVAVLDTAISARMVTMAGVRRTFERRSARAQAVAARARPGSDSGVESILRQRLIARGHHVEQQVAVPGGLRTRSDARHRSRPPRRPPPALSRPGRARRRGCGGRHDRSGAGNGGDPCVNPLERQRTEEIRAVLGRNSSACAA